MDFIIASLMLLGATAIAYRIINLINWRSHDKYMTTKRQSVTEQEYERYWNALEQQEQKRWKA